MFVCFPNTLLPMDGWLAAVTVETVFIGIIYVFLDILEKCCILFCFVLSILLSSDRDPLVIIVSWWCYTPVFGGFTAFGPTPVLCGVHTSCCIFIIVVLIDGWTLGWLTF